MDHDRETQEYEAPQVRSLGSLHELTQGGFGGPFGGSHPTGPGSPGDPWHRGSW